MRIKPGERSGFTDRVSDNSSEALRPHPQQTAVRDQETDGQVAEERFF